MSNYELLIVADSALMVAWLAVICALLAESVVAGRRTSRGRSTSIRCKLGFHRSHWFICSSSTVGYATWLEVHCPRCGAPAFCWDSQWKEDSSYPWRTAAPEPAGDSKEGG